MEFSMNFDGVRNNLCPVRSLSPAEGHYFFGYYDLMAYSPDGRRHLCGKLPFDGVLNTPGDVMEFGWLEDGEFTKLFETNCWNFQQGILGQYRWNGGNVIYYNVYDEAAGCYRTVRHDLDTGERRYSSMGCASVSRDGRYGLGVNFSRIWDFRPGYGYPNYRDPYYDIPQPKEDGVFLCSFEDGTTRQLIDCETLGRLYPLEGRESAKMVVNHITFNPSGTRYLFLYRNIFIHEMATGRTEILLSTFSPHPDDPVHGVPNGTKEARCDLHARWNRDGTRLSFDAVARGHREIYEVDMTKMPF